MTFTPLTNVYFGYCDLTAKNVISVKKKLIFMFEKKFLKKQRFLVRISRWLVEPSFRLLAATLMTVALLLTGTLVGSILFSVKLNGLASARKSALLSAESENRDAKMRLVESNILKE